MKVMHLETGRHLYGGALQVFYLLRGLHAQGVENVLVCSRGSDIGRAAADYAEVIEIPMAGDIDPRFGLGLGQAIKATRPDILHVHSRRGADWWGGLLARRFGVPALVTRRVDNPESRVVASFKYGLYDRVASISQGICQVLRQAGVADEKLTLIHSAVDLERYRQPADRAWFAAEFGLAPQEKTVGVFAQMIPRKGHRTLLQAAAKILAAAPATRFIFFGKGPLRQELETFCREIGVEKQVLFAGFRDDLHRVFPNLDVLAHPAQMEGLGVSLLQAAAAGVPIVAGRAGGIPEVVADGDNGYLLDPFDVEGFAERISRLLTDPELAQVLGEGGKRKSEAFSIAAMVTGYEKLYAEMIASV